MAHQAREYVGFIARTIFGMSRAAVGGWLDRGPWRGPQRIHAGGFVQYLGNVAAFRGNCETHTFGFDVRGSAISVLYFIHATTSSKRIREAGNRVDFPQNGWTQKRLNAQRHR